MGFLGGLFGGGGGGTSASEQTALNNMTNLQNQAQTGINTLTGENSQYYQPVLGGLSSAYQGLDTGVSGNTQGNAAALTGSGGNLQGLTGVNPYSSAASLVSYAGNPSTTNLSQSNPALQGFYGNEMTQGLNPGIVSGQEAGLQNSGIQAMNTAVANAMPGQNINALEQAGQNNLLQNQATLGTNLAQESQNAMNAGAQGVAGTAANLDAQKLNMLGTANQAAQGVNTNALTNLNDVTSAGTNILGQSNTFAGQGAQNLQAGIGDYSSLAGQQQNLASSMASQQAANQRAGSGLFGGLISGLGSVLA